MKLLLLVSLAGWVLSCSALVDPVTRISRQHVETFWESWDMTHSNYGSNLSALPVVPIGSVGGFNVVNLAFADADATSFDVTKCYLNPDCVTPGLYFMNDNENHDAFHRSIQAIHDAGGFVKIAFGGENSYNPGENLNQEELAFLVERIKKFVNDFKLDGVEFTFNSCWNDFCDHPERPIYLINSLRYLMPHKIISMTVPGDLHNYLYQVIMATLENIDYIAMVHGQDTYLNRLIGMGVPRSKIVWGYVQGLNSDNDHEPCDALDLVESVTRVKSEQLGGVMTWSINSDTYYRRDQYPDVPAGECSRFQTGQEDGTFIRTASYHLNQL